MYNINNEFDFFVIIRNSLIDFLYENHNVNQRFRIFIIYCFIYLRNY